VVTTIEKHLVRRKLGHLENEDTRALKALLTTIIGI
jgi:hypothetical protein